MAVVGQGSSQRVPAAAEGAAGSGCCCLDPSVQRGMVVVTTPPGLGSPPCSSTPRPSAALCPAAGPRAGLGSPWPPAALSVPDGFSWSGCFHEVLPGGPGLAVQYASSDEYLQQKLEPLRVYQDTAACRYV